MARWLSLLLFTILWAGPAMAQSRPTSWPAAERLVRAHFASTPETLIELTPRRDLRIGPVFWARRSVADGTFRGNLVFVRGAEVLSGDGEDALRAVLRADRVVETRAWSAATLLAVMQSFHVPIPFATDPITTHRVRALRPRIERSGGVLTLTIHTHRPGPPEAPSGEQYWVTRAVLTIDAGYAMTWSQSEVVLDSRGRERTL